MDPIVILVIAVVIVGAVLFLVFGASGKTTESKPTPAPGTPDSPSTGGPKSTRPASANGSEAPPASSPKPSAGAGSSGTSGSSNGSGASDTSDKSDRIASSLGSTGSGPAIEMSEVYEEAPEDKTGPNPLILVTAVGRTDPGLKRKHNEDSYLVLEDHSLFVVADGMGRHAAGEIASRLAVDTVGAAYTTNEFGDYPHDPKYPRAASRLLASFHLANQAILKESRQVEAYAGMGTTMVALHFSVSRKLAIIVHAGDSRCYRIRPSEIKQLTQDHTLGAAGIVGPSAYILSRAVGIEDHLEPDVTLEQPEADDLYLICSDGLSRMITNEAILECCQTTRNLDDVCKRLIDLANLGGGRDNVTVILVRVENPPGFS